MKRTMASRFTRNSTARVSPGGGPVVIRRRDADSEVVVADIGEPEASLEATVAMLATTWRRPPRLQVGATKR
jgi:hypothetical protein